MQEGEATSEQVLESAQRSQLFVWVHTHGWKTPGILSTVEVLKQLKEQDVPTMTYHLDLWKGIRREQDLINDEFYSHIGHFFTVDKLMADWFNEHTDVKGHYLPAGVYAPECYTAPKPQEYYKDVIFVGSKGYHTEWPWRPRLIDWLHDTYGDRFAHFGGDGLGIVRGDKLNRLYADAKVVIGDSLCLNYDYPYYWSDRVYETLGRGGFLLMPYIKGLRDEFNESELATFKFGDMQDLKSKIDFYLDNDLYRETIQKNGFNKVKNHYTYANRWQTVLTELGFLVKV